MLGRRAAPGRGGPGRRVVDPPPPAPGAAWSWSAGLAAEIFAAEDVAGRTRLWLPGDRAGAAWRSRQDGLRLMAEGALAGIEHVEAAGWKLGCSRQEALEYLAVLSTVARWTDETETHRL